MAELPEGKDDVIVERVTLRGTDGVEVEAIHARPEGMPKLGIALHPDIMGIRPLFDDICRRLASNGFAVCCPEPFTRAPADLRGSTDVPALMAQFGRMDDDQQLGDLEAAADYVVVHDDVARVAVMGFCMGGMQALKAAAGDRFDRAVSFYGMIRPPEPMRGPKMREPLDTAADVCPTLAIVGGLDGLAPPADVEALRAAWAGRPDCEIVVYPEADHAFVHDPDRPVHRPADAADAWRRVIEFLNR
ncbi:MAG: dienelactone hydrolase family protein [Acidimicrobiia bacterium]|jgi:carboxymethylenebutenolidase